MTYYNPNKPPGGNLPDFDKGANVYATGNNPAYARADFLAFHPQFTGHVADAVIDKFIAVSNEALSHERLGEMWEIAMGLMVAHHSTLYVEATGAGSGITSAKLTSQGGNKGVLTSKTGMGVSASYDVGQTSLDGNFGAWNKTTYGSQLTALVAPYFSGGAYVS